jgi:hypothetical protein
LRLTPEPELQLVCCSVFAAAWQDRANLTSGLSDLLYRWQTVDADLLRR